jgi:hypothetical protein
MRFNWCNADKIQPALTSNVEARIQSRTTFSMVGAY